MIASDGFTVVLHAKQLHVGYTGVTPRLPAANVYCSKLDKTYWIWSRLEGTIVSTQLWLLIFHALGQGRVVVMVKSCLDSISYDQLRAHGSHTYGAVVVGCDMNWANTHLHFKCVHHGPCRWNGYHLSSGRVSTTGTINTTIDVQSCWWDQPTFNTHRFARSLRFGVKFPSPLPHRAQPCPVFRTISCYSTYLCA